jgi:hypothetical protein
MKLHQVLVGLTAPLAATAAAQQQPQGPRNFATMKVSQSFATAKLAKSPRKHEWVSIRMGDRTARRAA